MSNLAYKSAVRKENQHSQHVVPKKQTSVKYRVTPGERILTIFLVALIALGCIFVLTNYARIYSANKDIQQLHSSIDKQIKVNSGLNEKISELNNPKRILEIAEKEGLTINDNNVQVITKKSN